MRTKSYRVQERCEKPTAVKTFYLTWTMNEIILANWHANANKSPSRFKTDECSV